MNFFSIDLFYKIPKFLFFFYRVQSESEASLDGDSFKLRTELTILQPKMLHPCSTAQRVYTFVA